MNGQWIGKAAGGDGTATLIVNIDKRDSRYEGIAFIHDDEPTLPRRDRRQAMNELSYMGITAGSLFPGLDGACEELKERNFE